MGAALPVSSRGNKGRLSQIPVHWKFGWPPDILADSNPDGCSSSYHHMNPTTDIKTFWAYVYTDKEIYRYAKRTRQPFARRGSGMAVIMMARAVYNRLTRYGPVRLYRVAIGREHGMMLALGYPNQEPKDLPFRLVKHAIHLLRSPPLLVIQEGEFYEFKIPAVDGKGFDKLTIDTPEKTNNSWAKWHPE